MGDDESNLTAGHHTNADFKAIAGTEAAAARRQTAADDLAEQGDGNKGQREQENIHIEGRKIGFETDAGEENRPEDEVAVDIHLFGNAAGIADVAQNDAGEIGTGDIRHAKPFFGDIGHEQAETEA